MPEVKNPDSAQIAQVRIDSQTYYQISNVDKMRPFFMSIVSNSNHWMFIGSNGGLSAGRRDADNALFPYYTSDKIMESAETTGSKSIFRVQKNGAVHLWEPFSIRGAGLHHTERNLYKNLQGNKILFEEVNHDLKLTFQYQWNSSHLYGFVKRSRLINNDTVDVNVSALDGIQNIMPYGVSSAQQSQVSNLVDAYKRSELKKEAGVGIFALSATIIDKPEPCEALKANVAWSVGLDNPKHLLSSLQLEDFRMGSALHEEQDIKAEKGAYFVSADVTIASGDTKDWMIVANVNQSVTQIVEIAKSITSDKHLEFRIKEDIERGTERLIKLNASADGIQLSKDRLRDTRHFSNTLFNIMRGGIFDDNYQIEKKDLTEYLQLANKEVFHSCQGLLNPLPPKFDLSSLKALSKKSNNSDLIRLCVEYLPLRFSRRHGDPSRPWNKFSINTRSEIDGSKIMDYEGNWRDIFQNWEALAHSYPEFIEGMIFKFLNASTFDGYNPYRITKNGIDWERIEADDPWSFIGYWGDHQIIYLLKFLEFIENHAPGKLESYFNKDLFVYANVPYKIKRYEDILSNPKDTIDFDHALDEKIQKRAALLGADSALLVNQKGEIHHVNFIEKILASVLAKVSNFIPEGGIWMNTQRPEWNDANNALVGNGVSVVTLCYLTRFLKFFNTLLADSKMEKVSISEELMQFFKSSTEILRSHQQLLSAPIDDINRKLILDGLGTAGSKYRFAIYENSFSDSRQELQLEELQQFVKLCLSYLEHTINANRRSDSLYHSYNLMTVESDQKVSLSHLSEMLEGQVAILSAQHLSSEEALQVLDGLKSSSLFREDQYSYMLYPNKELPGFLEKNNIPKSAISDSELLSTLVKDGNTKIVEEDVNGAFHFNGSFKNSTDLKIALEKLAGGPYAKLVSSGQNQVLQVFEQVFNHKAFTGRSGTFFGYEGLGSIYWHMVSKLQLAVQECCLKAMEEQASEEVVGRLLEHYYEINEGIGIHKPPTLYGAFPTDPYSHTPFGRGAQQPGMTGQVKEDFLSRFGELGVFVKRGKLLFNPCMLRKDEFLTARQTFKYVDLGRNMLEMQAEPGALCFTYCQVPIIYKLAQHDELEITFNDGTTSKVEGLSLDEDMSQKVFGRTGEIVKIVAQLNQTQLR
ncbi:MAG: hypothetical protein RIB47_06800 [Cyclobacteriaceae bacterium]